MIYHAKTISPNEIHLYAEGTQPPDERLYQLERRPDPERDEYVQYDSETDAVVIKRREPEPPPPDRIAVLTARLDAMEAEIIKFKEQQRG